MTQPMLEIKAEYTQSESFIPGLPLYHMVIRIHNIRKLIAITRKYSYYKKRIRLPMGMGITLMKEVLYEPHPQCEKHRKPKIPSSLYQELTELAEIMKQTPLPFPYVKQQNLFNDVLFHLVNKEVVKNRGCCCCSFFSSFSYTLRHKESLKECLVDMADAVYKIQSGAVLILPDYYYRENKIEEQNHFQRMTEIGLKEKLLVQYPISDISE
jgi:hypothetical protein